MSELTDRPDMEWALWIFDAAIAECGRFCCADGGRDIVLIEPANEPPEVFLDDATEEGLDEVAEDVFEGWR